MEDRKVIQISSVQETDKHEALLFALCDDGTLWYGCPLQSESWYPISAPPPAEKD